MGDPRTGGKGSQRRKVKVVSKATVISCLFREAMIRLSRTSSRRLEHNPSPSTKSTSSEMITPSSTSKTQKVTPTLCSLRLHPEQHLHREWRARDKDRQGSPPWHYPTTWPQATQTPARTRVQCWPGLWGSTQPSLINPSHQPWLSRMSMIQYISCKQ